MALHRIRKGLDIPIAGEPRQALGTAPPPTSVALVPRDHVGLRPRMLVQVGDAVRRGQPLFEDKSTPGVLYTSPAAGRVAAVHRGERRAYESVVIELSERERAGEPGPDELQEFRAFAGKDPAGLSPDAIEALLLESGLWTSFRTRPFGKVPAPGSRPRSIFVAAMNTHPLAADVDVAVAGREAAFAAGVRCVARLVAPGSSCGATFVCLRPGSRLREFSPEGVRVEEFEGPHPAGTPGLHIHVLDPVCRGKTVWYLDYEDAIAIGTLFLTGRLDPRRVVSLAGPAVRDPRLLWSRLGASVDELVRGELLAGDLRVVSGSVLTGREARGPVRGYLGRHHLQVTALEEGRKREFLGWLAPGWDKFSVIPMFLSRLRPRRAFAFTTSMNGSRRPIVPFGTYERVFPFDMVATYLLRAIASGDVEEAEKLGCLELEEEDVALASFVCPGKNDFGSLLRKVLDSIEQEG